MIKAISINEEGKVNLTLTELNELIWDAYDDGYKLGLREGKLEEKILNYEERIKDLENKKNKKNLTITPEYPYQPTPIPLEKRITWDWNKVTCNPQDSHLTGSPIMNDQSITTCTTHTKDDGIITLKAKNNWNDEVFIGNTNTKKEKKKNGRK